MLGGIGMPPAGGVDTEASVLQPDATNAAAAMSISGLYQSDDWRESFVSFIVVRLFVDGARRMPHRLPFRPETPGLQWFEPLSRVGFR